MGNADTKLNFRKAVVQLTSKTQVNKKKIAACLPAWSGSIWSVDRSIREQNFFNEIVDQRENLSWIQLKNLHFCHYVYIKFMIEFTIKNTNKRKYITTFCCKEQKNLWEHSKLNMAISQDILLYMLRRRSNTCQKINTASAKFIKTSYFHKTCWIVTVSVITQHSECNNKRKL